MKQDILKIAGVKSEAAFYKKFPSEEAFMKVHGKAFKKAKMGAAMVKKQLTQLTDFSNPPQAEMGSYMGGETTGYQNVDFGKVYGDIDSSIGVGSQMEEMQDKLDYLKQQDQGPIASASQQGGSKDDMMQKAGQAIKIAGMVAGGVPGGKRGIKVPKYQDAGQVFPSAVDSAFNLGTPMNMSGATNSNPYTYQNLNPQPVPVQPV